jgi:hypothetical protein
MLVVVGSFVYRIGQPRLMTRSELQANGLYPHGTAPRHR